MYRPIQAPLPRLDQITIQRAGFEHTLPYLYRKGNGGPSVFLVHGLGGAKENFYSAFQSPALADCTLLTFDEPGTGLAKFAPDAQLDVSALADLAQAVADELLPEPYFLAGSSMGGLINLLQLRRHGVGRVQGLINLEGNLMPEDCMFSRRVVPLSFEAFSNTLFGRMADELRGSRYSGDQITAANMLLNVDDRGYYAYSFQTVAESDSGRLLDEFLQLRLPRLFLYGEANRSLSYLPRLRESSIEVKEIPGSAHFFFYDNPVATFEAIGKFVRAHATHSQR